MKKALLSVVTFALVFMFNPLQAQQVSKQPSASPFSSYSSQAPGPRETIQQGVDRIKAFLDTDDRANPVLVNAFIEKEIAPIFDFNAMTKLVLGPAGYRLTRLQKQAAALKIKRSFLTALANNLIQYRGGEVRYIKVLGRLHRGQVKVRLAILQADRYPTIIELRFSNGPSGWKAVDVSANGVSAVAYFRNYINAIIQRSGPDGLMQ